MKNVSNGCFNWMMKQIKTNEKCIKWLFQLDDETNQD